MVMRNAVAPLAGRDDPPNSFIVGLNKESLK